MLRKVELDGQVYVVPAHSTDREAIDEFYDLHSKRFDQRLGELSDRHGSPTKACKLWSAILALRQGKTAEIKKLPVEVRLNWGPTLLEEAARGGGERAIKLFTEVRRELLKDRHHFWSMRELVFETIRVWPMLKDDRSSREFLENVLSERKLGGLDGKERMGRYLVLEAMLYVQAATYPGTWDMAAYTRVWDQLSSARYLLFDEPQQNIRELALLFDAFTWCPPRLEPRDLRRWLEPLVDVIADHGLLKTAMLFSSLHHPEGFKLLADELGELDIKVQERGFDEQDAELASFLISWHFIHQSRGRALLYRRSLEPAHSYLLHRIPGPRQPTLPEEIGERCRRAIDELARFPKHAGWGVHLAVSLATQRKGFDPSFVAEHIVNLPEADEGAIAAALTYEIPADLLPAFLEYFKREENLDAYLGVLSKPRQIRGVKIGPPPFCASRPPWQLFDPLEIGWEELEEDGIPVRDQYSFLETLHAAAADLSAEPQAQIPDHALESAVAEIASGDLRRLEKAPLHRLLSEDRTTMSAQALLSQRLCHVAEQIAKEQGQ